MKRIIPPLKGINKKLSHSDSGELPSSEFMQNVRPVDGSKRLRLGQRPGVDKWADGTNFDDAPIVFITVVHSVE